MLTIGEGGPKKYIFLESHKEGIHSFLRAVGGVLLPITLHFHYVCASLRFYLIASSKLYVNYVLTICYLYITYMFTTVEATE
jgi:hypothetical protein